jgi:NitT/TauT family transport system ATP-binding protein
VHVVSGDRGTSVRFDGVSKWFRRDDQVTHALSRVSLDIAAGEFVSLIGPSGCGKSTILRVLGGLIEPDKGTVTVGALSPSEARKQKQFALVPQHPALLPWRTVADNVSLLCQVNTRSGTSGISTDAQRKLIDDIGLGPFIDALPKELSGGMQQRVSIARAFALDAPVMLLAEPFSALDEITRADMKYLLLDLWARVGSTAVFVTHSIPEAVALSDRVVVLGGRPGNVVTTIPVGLERPRTEAIEDSPEFHEIVAEVRAALKQGWSN